jgi:spore coat protein CotH
VGLWNKKNEDIPVMLAVPLVAIVLVVITIQKEEESKKLSTHVDVNIYLIMKLYWNIYVPNMKEN